MTKQEAWSLAVSKGVWVGEECNQIDQLNLEREVGHLWERRLKARSKRLKRSKLKRQSSAYRAHLIRKLDADILFAEEGLSGYLKRLSGLTAVKPR